MEYFGVNSGDKELFAKKFGYYPNIGIKFKEVKSDGC
jgi:hypothetical protein